jgi:hypothetical protein
LEPDPVAATVVQRIFSEYSSGVGIYAIAQRLTADGIPCPAAADPQRNRHRCGIAWAKSAVRVILTNPRYTGHQVWNRQRKQESLIDVEDVALGHQTTLKWNPRDAWILSDQPVHMPVVTKEQFEDVQRRLASRGPASTGREVVRTHHSYALKGRLFHHACGRRMQGNWAHGQAYYRCRFPNEYALANKVDHRLNVYLREADILEPMDAWLADAFAPHRIQHSLAALERSQLGTDADAQAIHRTLAECDRKLARHRAALEAGADPKLIAGWSREVQTQRAAAEARLAHITGSRGTCPRMSRDEIHTLVDAVGGLLSILHAADAADKAEVYRQLGLRLTYDDETHTVLAESLPTPPVGVLVVSEGGLEHVFVAVPHITGSHAPNSTHLGRLVSSGRSRVGRWEVSPRESERVVLSGEGCKRNGHLVQVGANVSGGHSCVVPAVVPGVRPSDGVAEMAFDPAERGVPQPPRADPLGCPLGGSTGDA